VENEINNLNRYIHPIYENVSNIIRNSKSSLPNDTWKNYIDQLSDSIGKENNELIMLRLNKKIRNESRLKNGLPIRFPQINQKEIKNNSVNLKNLVNEILKKSSFPFQSADDFVRLVYPNEITVLSKFENEIIRLSAISDFLGVTSEKLKKETAFKSISADLKHLVFALRSNIFLSNDNNLICKAKFISTWLGLSNQILGIEEFIQLYS
jgi:hypothetical protein